jgi:hypothetical protein
VTTAQSTDLDRLLLLSLLPLPFSLRVEHLLRDVRRRLVRAV